MTTEITSETKMSTISNSYHGCSNEDIMSMPEDELRQAVIRMFSSVRCINFAKTDSWMGSFMLPDDVADAFRDRL